MGLPDLYQVTAAIAHVVVAGVAQAADQVPAVPQAPIPNIVALPPDLRGLGEIIVNLGGWGVLLWSLVTSLRNQAAAFGAGVTGRLDSLTREVRRLSREMRRIRHSPPPAAYSDGEIPEPSKE